MEKVENPYIAARKEWSERYGEYFEAARQWRKVALGTSAVSIILAVFIGVQSMQSKLVPYIVEVDKIGRVVNSQLATKTTLPNSNLIKAALASFITDLRSISSDKEVLSNNLHRANNFLPKGGSSTHFISEYVIKKNPFEESAFNTVSVDIVNILQLSDKMWQVEWDETTRNLKGFEQMKKRWKASLSINYLPPDSESKILANPLGLYITELNWSEQI